MKGTIYLKKKTLAEAKEIVTTKLANFIRLETETIPVAQSVHRVTAEPLFAERGRGLEFADTRPYPVGDDFRHIDWKAYRRLGRLLLRLFDEEQDLPIYLRRRSG